ncbi:MAG: hypothetical protein P1U46_01740 [Patescibacteria group bacterium]|nr:hypothetical protein [Patescibacteria group bacterium]
MNNKFYLLDDFVNIFLKSYNPMEKVKDYFKNKDELELVIINESIRTKLKTP